MPDENTNYDVKAERQAERLTEREGEKENQRSHETSLVGRRRGANCGCSGTSHRAESVKLKDEHMRWREHVETC